MQILRRLIKEGESIVIGGKVSSGKTELQKWLLQNMAPCTRVIVIDDVEELDMVVPVIRIRERDADEAGTLPLNAAHQTAPGHFRIAGFSADAAGIPEKQFVMIDERLPADHAASRGMAGGAGPGATLLCRR